jgi:hypothetical protein
VPVVVAAFIVSFAPATVLLGLFAHAMTHQTLGSIVLITAILGIAVAVWLRNWLEFPNTYGHEHAHMFAALMLFRRVSEVRASSEAGGQLSYHGEPSLWVASAPYTLPLLAIVASIAALFQHGATGRQVASAAIGFFLGYHLAVAAQHTARNIRVRAIEGAPTDFTTFGRVWTCLYIWTLNVAVVGTLFAFAAGGSRGAQRFWRDSGQLIVHRAAAWLDGTQPKDPLRIP